MPTRRDDNQAPPTGPVPKSLTVGERLIRRGVVTRAQVEEALEAQTIFGGRLGTNLLELGYIDERTLNEVLAEKFALAPIEADLTGAEPDPETLALVPAALAEKHRLVPLRREGRRLYVLMTDPSNLAVIDELSFLTGHLIKPSVAAEARVLYLLEKFYRIRRETRYVMLTQDKSKRSARAEPSWEAAAASEAMRMNWVGEEEGAYKVSAPWELPEGEEEIEELLPEDLHEELVARATSNASRGEPSASQPTPPGIGRNPQVARPAPRPLAGKLGRRIEQAGARLVGEGAPRAAGPVEKGPLTVEEASARLAEVEGRDEVALILMDFARTRCRRAALFIVRMDAIFGWDATGEGVNVDAVRKIRLAAEDLSIFHKVIEAKAPLVSDLNADAGRPALAGLVGGLGGGAPRSALVIPILIRGRIVNLFYADNGPDALAPGDIGDYLTVFECVPQAFETLLRKRKAMVSEG